MDDKDDIEDEDVEDEDVEDEDEEADTTGWGVAEAVARRMAEEGG